MWLPNAEKFPMMQGVPLLNKLSGAFPATLIYITVGILIDIWSLIWLAVYQPESRTGYFWAFGFLGTGTALLIIGLLLGRIGRAARKAELPPEEIVHAVAQLEKIAAVKQQPKQTEEQKSEGKPPPPSKPQQAQPPPQPAPPAQPAPQR
jgi:hypothetical protein